MLEAIISISLLYWISHSLLFADFYKVFKCRFFNKNARKSKENVCEQWEITKSYHWIFLIIRISFSQPVLNNYLV